MSKKMKIGILGCGAVAYRWYLKGLCKKNRKYSLELVCDINKVKAIKAAKDFNVPYWCTSIKDTKKYNLDLIVILTRHDDHFKNIKYFLNNNLNVYSEKPFVSSVEEGKYLINLAKKKKLIIGSAPQIMLSSRNQKVKQFIDKNKLGKITFVRASCSNLGPAGRADTNYNPEWFYNEGGSLLSLGIYGLSALIWFLGVPQLISSFQEIVIPEREVLFGPAKGKKFKVTSPDNVTGMFKYKNGAIALFDGSYSVATAPKYDFEIHGTKGSLFVGGFGGPESILFKPLFNDYKKVGPNDDCHLKWNLSWGVEETINAILEKRETKTSAKFALQVIDIIQRMKISAKEKRFVNINERL